MSKRYIRLNERQIKDTEKNKRYYTNGDDGAGGYDILHVLNRQDNELRDLKKRWGGYPDLLRENHHLKLKLSLIENNIKFI